MLSERDWDNFLVFSLPLPKQPAMEVPLPDGFYACLGCQQVTNYYPRGGVCAQCEAESELREEN